MGGAELKILGEIVIAMALGAVIGLERELAGKPAGIRTHMLVTGAAALFVAMGMLLVTHAVVAAGEAVVAADPIRIVQAIVIGVSFLGAGTIFRAEREETVHGLSTAASLLMASGIGVAVALDELRLATAVTVLVVVVLRVIGWLEGVMHKRGW